MREPKPANPVPMAKIKRPFSTLITTPASSIKRNVSKSKSENDHKIWDMMKIGPPALLELEDFFNKAGQRERIFIDNEKGLVFVVTKEIVYYALVYPNIFWQEHRKGQDPWVLENAKFPYPEGWYET